MAATSLSTPVPGPSGRLPVELTRYINLKLAALGQPTCDITADPYFLEIAGPLLRNHHQKDLLLAGRLCPSDQRVQAFLDSYLEDICPEGAPRLPSNSFVLDRPGMARVMSLPAGSDTFRSPYLSSYRVAQGVLHNPASDRRTTQGIFHIVEGGIPVPADKFEVPKIAFARLLSAALRYPEESLTLPFTSDQEQRAHMIVSLLLRPVVCPAAGSEPVKTMEIRFFAPASLVSNLDFVEAIFGNGGDPYLPENDAALDTEHWTGHTGCVILAPQLVGLKKKDLGLPHYDQATARQRRDGMCWRKDDELYNEGRAFKVACRDMRGVMVTLIADNYFGYCKKEVKTQISYAANLYGRCEEEHAGGAIAFASYVIGHEFLGGRTLHLKERPFMEAMRLLGDAVDIRPEGYAVDRRFPDIYYIPEDSELSVSEGTVKWVHNGQPQKLTLRARDVYIMPSGYRIRLEKQHGGTRWRLVGTRPEGTLCHKPCTVSGGGKSEISKSIVNAMHKGPVFVRDYHSDFEQVAEILRRDFSDIYKRTPSARAKRPVLSPERSLGSVIKLLTPSKDYKDDYNDWLRRLPQTIRQLVFTVKRYYRPEWGENWRQHFTVDRINGFLGHELKFEEETLVANYLRVGFDLDGSWRIHKLRPDFHPAEKVQVEDDITASVVVPRELLKQSAVHGPEGGSVKLVQNCESKLFQRPDDAVHRGFDKQAEADIASDGVFLSNFEPLNLDQASAIMDRIVDFDKFSDPVKKLFETFVHSRPTEWLVSSAHPRLVDGKPSKNPRYLQRRPDLENPRETHIAEVGARLDRGVPQNEPLWWPVDAVLAGRRGNPPEPAIGLPPLAVYGPIHYQELPELFMDFISSLTGKSPSTTGFGSEGALTKRPFNALPPVVDVNNAIVAAILTEYAGFTSAAGYIGPYFKVEHDISMLVPEIWCRMSDEERKPAFLIDNGYLEKINDFEYNGQKVLGSRLGYRITPLFVDHYCGRIFETPNTVLTEELLRPETQDLAAFVSGVNAIVESQRGVALEYFEDNSVEAACPPLKALLHIMAHGHYQGMTADSPEFRSLFTREALLASEWYAERLRTMQSRDIALWERHVESLEWAAKASVVTRSMDLDERLRVARARLDRVRAPQYLNEIRGTIGADPFSFAGSH